LSLYTDICEAMNIESWNGSKYLSHSLIISPEKLLGFFSHQKM
jgi:hypothetical protein